MNRIVEDLANIFQLNNREDTRESLSLKAQHISEKWCKRYPDLIKLSNPNFMSYYSTYQEFEYEIRNMICTTNWIERLNKSFKRTLKIRNSMPKVESVLTLLSKVTIHINHTTYQYSVSRLSKSHKFN
nr:transposase [Marinomonas algicola]